MPQPCTPIPRRVYIGRDNTRARLAFERALTADKRQVGALEGLAALDIMERSRKPPAPVPRGGPRCCSERRRRAPGRGPHLWIDEPFLEAAENALKKVLALNPNSLDGFMSLGRSTRRPAGSRKPRRSSSGSPQQTPILLASTRFWGSCSSCSTPAEAKARYSKALEIDPRAAVAANNLAWMYAENGENSIRRCSWRRRRWLCCRRNPGCATRSGGCIAGSSSDIGVATFRQNVREEPRNGKHQYRLGLAQKGVGDVDAARRSMVAALALPLPPTEASDAKRILSTLQ